MNSKKDATPPATPTAQIVQNGETPQAESVIPQEPFVPPLPWLSVQDQPFPSRARRAKRKVTRSSLGTEPVTFPLPEAVPEDSAAQIPETGDDVSLPETQSQILQKELGEQVSAPTPTQTPTPLASDAPSDSISTQPTTPSSVTPVPPSKSQRTPTQARPVKAAVPVVPVVPVLPHSPTTARVHRDSTTSKSSKPEESTSAETQVEQQVDLNKSEAEPEQASSEPPPPPPSSWAALLRSKNAAIASGGAIPSLVANGLSAPKGESLGEVLNEISLTEKPTKVAFLQPRGLVNTGNMCYMNSVCSTPISD